MQDAYNQLENDKITTSTKKLTNQEKNNFGKKKHLTEFLKTIQKTNKVDKYNYLWVKIGDFNFQNTGRLYRRS